MPSLAATAHHEAGHAIALAEYGIEILEADIIPDRGSFGRVKHENIFWQAELDRSADCVVRSLKAVTVWLAGPAAEEAFDPNNWHPDCERADFAEAIGLCRYHTSDPDEAVLLVEVLWRRAADLVRRRWPQVTAVAAALLERRRLSGAEVRAIIDGRWNASGRLPPWPGADAGGAPAGRGVSLIANCQGRRAIGDPEPALDGDGRSPAIRVSAIGNTGGYTVGTVAAVKPAHGQAEADLVVERRPVGGGAVVAAVHGDAGVTAVRTAPVCRVTTMPVGTQPRSCRGPTAPNTWTDSCPSDRGGRLRE